MRSIRLSIKHTDETIHPMHAFVCESNYVEREILLEGKSLEETRTLLFYVEGDREAYENILKSRPDIEEYKIASGDDEGFYLYVQAPNRYQEKILFDAFRRETVVVVPPIEFRSDRTVHLTVIGPPTDIQELIEDLPNDMEVEILRVGEYSEAVGAKITDRQREALTTAWEQGYYEVPRKSGIKEVAKEMDSAVSTVSDLLRRAESQLVSEVLGKER